MSHHGRSFPDPQPLDPDQQKAMHDAMSKLLGEFPDGKLNQNDEGALAVMIGSEGGRVIVRFPKPVAWIGFTPEQALDIAQTLISHARKAGLPVPLVLRVGGSLDAARKE